MKIVDAKVIVCSPGRNFVTLKLTTEDGVYGLGDATLNGRELAVASYLEEHVVPLLIGRDARRIEDTWQYLYKGAYWRRGPVTMTAIAAVDTALWDIKGKALGVPVYQLLGGALARRRHGLRPRAAATTIEETVACRRRLLELGYKAVRAQSGVPGLASDLRRRPRRAALRARRAGAAARERVEHREVPRLVPPLFERLRDEFGPDVHLLHDVHHRLTPDRGGAPGQGARAVSPVLDGGPGARRAPGRLPADPPAHHDADRGRRSVQLASTTASS